MRKPIITFNLTFFKKKSKKFQLLRHYNYNFINEYQFSPSNNSPLLFLGNERRYLDRKEKKHYYIRLKSMLFMCVCFGSRVRAETRDEARSRVVCVDDVIEEERIMCEFGGSEDDGRLLSSVDERAGKFIEEFYAQMRMQTQESSTLTS
ncbi:hypothetical protein vseg_019755 [Gypsophila vaccaria]